MQNNSARPAAIRRPKILVNTARACARQYRRGRVVARLVPSAQQANRTAVIQALQQAEAEANAARKQGDITYSVRQHIDLLAALIAEQTTPCKPR